MLQRKTPQKEIDRSRAWALAHPERRKEIARRSYLKLRPPLKPVLTPQQRFDSLYTPEAISGCWLWLGAVDKNGYGKAKVNGVDIRSHRWSWNLHKGDIPAGLHVLHRCDVPACVNPNHLWLGTNVENDKDKRAKGRHFVQPIHREAKLNEEQVKEIRRLRGKETIVGLSKRFGVHHSQISRIQNNKYWRHIAEGQNNA